MLFDDHPVVAIGTNKLGGRSHYTRDRFLSMILRSFMSKDRIVVTANRKTQMLALQLITILEESTNKGFFVEEHNIMRKGSNGDEMDIFYWIVDKKPLLRRRLK